MCLINSNTLEQFDNSDRQYLNEIRNEAFEEAEARDCEIVLADDFHLQLDFDVPWPEPGRDTLSDNSIVSLIKHQSRSKHLWKSFDKNFQIKLIKSWKSSGGNCHVEIELFEPLTAEIRIALQAILGSDPMRELSNLRRVKCGADDPVALFKPK